MTGNHAERVTREPRTLTAGGAPLAIPVRRRMEGVFGADLAAVRVHEGSEALALGAAAFAYGEHLHFAPGVYDPSTPDGIEVLAHEIAHVLQQRSGRASGPVDGRFGVLDDPRLEREAELCGRLAREDRSIPAGLFPRRETSVARPVAQPIKLTLGKLSAVVVLNQLENAIGKIIANGAVKPKIDDGKIRYVFMTEPGNWLEAVGRLAITGDSKQAHWLPCSLLIPANEGSKGKFISVQVDATGEPWSERLLFEGFTKKDLNYGQIANLFATEFSGFDDIQIATEMLNCLMCKPWGKGMSDRQANIAVAMVALLFGVEASRFRLSLAGSLMLFDLVIQKKCYGRNGTKKFDLWHAFQGGSRGSELNWDVVDFKGQSQWYGGKHPLATHGTGSGNMSAYGKLLDGYLPIENLQLLNQRHAVPRRAVTLFIHWLESHFGDTQIPNLTEADVEGALYSRLKEAFVDRKLGSTFSQSPRQTSGQHLVDLVPDKKVCWMDRGQFYHRNKSCKLIQTHLTLRGVYLREFSVKDHIVKKYDDREELYPNQIRAVEKLKNAEKTVKLGGAFWRGTVEQALFVTEKRLPQVRQAPLISPPRRVGPRSRW